MEEPRGLAAALMSTWSALDQADEKAIETALTTLAMSLGASRIETGTIKALLTVGKPSSCIIVAECAKAFIISMGTACLQRA